MSVVGKAKAKYEGKSGRGAGEYTVIYLVETNNAKDGPIIVGRAPGLPQEDATPYSTGSESDTGALCRRRSFKQTADFYWEVTCPFSPSPTPRPVTAPQLVDDPTNRAPVITWTTREVFETREKDLDNKPFQNKVGTPFVPAPEIPVTHVVYTVTRNEALFNGSTAYKYTNTVNSAPFKDAPKYTAKLAIRATQQFEQTAEGDFYFWQVVYEVEFNPRQWQPLEILNAGPQHFTKDDDGKTTTTKVFGKDDENQKSTQPVKLAFDGSLLDKTFDPYYLEFRIYELKDWTPLRLP